MLYNKILNEYVNEEMCSKCPYRRKDGTCGHERCAERDIPNEIRLRRRKECFPIVNRGQVWYNTLTDDQKAELTIWYKLWLDAPKTKIIPTKPSWLK